VYPLARVPLTRTSLKEEAILAKGLPALTPAVLWQSTNLETIAPFIADGNNTTSVSFVLDHRFPCIGSLFGSLLEF
jgi:hypothetical protein